MKALVTGATGFIGSNVVRALLERGYQVRALTREGSNLSNLAGLDVELAVGDVRERASLERAMEGCDCLFHLAAAYALWTPDPQPIYDINVDGTVNALAAARAAGVHKVVYTSSESTIGIARNGEPGTEALFAEPDELAGHYKRSKYLAEQVALRASEDGLDVVVVNPTTPIGRGDIRPTPTGQIVVDFLNGRMPAYVNTGLNLVDVDDVAVGHVLALEKGRPGERYILGNKNLTLKEILAALGRVTGRRAPRLRLPLWVALGAAYVSEFTARRVTGGPPRIPVTGVKVARHFRYFDCSKAVRELGMPQTPIEEALDKAVRWFREHGYAP